MKITMATSWWARMRGLLGTERFEGILMLVPCRAIHTIGMCYSLDVAFVGGDGRVLAAYKDVPPGRKVDCRDAVAVLERMASGESWINEGDWIEVVKGME